MGNLSRRSVLRTSLAAAAAGTLSRPYVANAAATTAEVWWVQGFAQDEPLEAYTRQGIFGPTTPPYEVYNPARAEVSTEHVFALAMNDVISNGMTPEAAIDKAFRRCEEIFAKYPIAQA